MSMRNPALFQRIFGTPLMILPSKLDAIIAGLGPRFGLEGIEAPSAYVTSPGEAKTPGYRVAHGVATVDVFGVLQHRGGVQADSSYVLGYDRIAQQLATAMDDPAVKAILLQMDSPGGEVSGAFALAQQIREMSATKPIRAVVSDLSASAAYLLASAANDIAISDTGLAGSIGVVMRHVDLSQRLAADGIRVEYVYSGAHKIDGNPHAPLADSVRADWQAEVDALRRQFAEAVGGYRATRLSADQAWATDAEVYRGQAAIDAGLADRLATADEVLAEMRSLYSKRVQPRAQATTRGKRMDDVTSDDMISAAAHATAIEAARKAGATDERARVLGILGHAEAEGRTAQALALAEAGLSVERAAKVLAAAPKAEPQAAVSPFAQHMAALGNPQVGAATGEEPNEAEQIDKSWARAFGRSGHA